MTDVVPSEELRLPMPWGHIAAKAWGSSNDKPVLVVHGLLDNAGIFDQLIPLLPCGFYFVCIDLPGHGFSSHFPAGIPLDHFQYVWAIRRVLDQLKWEKCIYMGHSFGALVGLIHTVLNPERTEKLIFFDLDSAVPVANDELIDCIKGMHDYVVRLEKNANRHVRLYAKEEVIRALTDLRIYVLNDTATEALLKRSVTKVGDKYKFNRDPRLNTGVIPFLIEEQHAYILKHLDTPVLVIMSSESVRVSNNGPSSIKIDKQNKKNHYVIVEGNHNVHGDYPERIAPYVSQFLGNPKSNL